MQNNWCEFCFGTSARLSTWQKPRRFQEMPAVKTYCHFCIGSNLKSLESWFLILKVLKDFHRACPNLKKNEIYVQEP